ncbi:MAG: MBL fold metallo-hydrolase [Desulfovermiculus sp.]
MQVVFLGVGEACDEKIGNTSLLVHTNTACILLDCGFSVAHALFSELQSPNELDAVWISHFHGDHFFSLPLLLLRLWETKRDKTLRIFGPSGIEEVISHTVRLAYPGFWGKFSFPIQFHHLEPGVLHYEFGCSWQTAWTEHSRPNLGLRLDEDRSSLYYSGDGRPGAETPDLVQGCSMLVHEGFKVDEGVHGHGTVQEVMNLAVQARAARLAVVHMQRDERKKNADRVRSMLDGMDGVQGFLPQPGERIRI